MCLQSPPRIRVANVARFSPYPILPSLVLPRLVHYIRQVQVPTPYDTLGNAE